MICDGPAGNHFCVCLGCVEVYGLQGAVSTWPAWARDMASTWRKQRKREKAEAGTISLEWQQAQDADRADGDE
jgi:hypothetical protein